MDSSNIPIVEVVENVRIRAYSKVVVWRAGACIVAAEIKK